MSTATPLKTLRASGTRLQAEVQVGANEYGSGVYVRVEIDRKDPELISMLAPVESLLRERALSYLSSSRDELELRQLVDSEVQATLAKERERIKKTAAELAQRELGERLRTAENARLRAERELELAKQKIERLQTTPDPAAQTS